MDTGPATSVVTSFDALPRGHFGAIYTDPPWRYEVWSGETAVKKRASGSGTNVAAAHHYNTMSFEDLSAPPVGELAAPNCVLFCWVTWPTLVRAIDMIGAWGFTYKTCAFDWTKAHARQVEMFQDETLAQMGMGYWTRANSEVCLLATRGKPKRLHADVRQAIIEPRRQHSRKPDCVYGRIERLVSGPYLEMFSRTSRDGWTTWGNQAGKFSAVAA